MQGKCGEESGSGGGRGRKRKMDEEPHCESCLRMFVKPEE